MGSRRALALLVALGATLVPAGFPAASAPAAGTPTGGTLTILSPIDPSRISLDPALSFNGFHIALGYATCATLMAFQNAPAPTTSRTEGGRRRRPTAKEW